MKTAMKIVLQVLVCLFSVLLLILSLAFIVIEGRLLFSGDWLVYDSPFNGFLRYFLRLLFALAGVATGIVEFVNLGKKSKALSEILFFTSLSLTVGAIVICFFATNYAGLACLGLTAPILLFKIPLLLIKSKTK